MERQGHLCVITIDRAQAHNALHPPASYELNDVFNHFVDDPDLWLAILTGTGEASFCAGNDLKYQAKGLPPALPSTGFGGLTARFGVTKPVIAAVNGLALGGGFELALACDIIIASANAEFALPEPRIGVAATSGGLLRLPRQIPHKRAMELILTGRRMDAAEAFTLGLVSEVVAPGQALSAAIRLAERILENSPLAVRAAKQIVNHGLDSPSVSAAFSDQRQLTAVQALYASHDFAEGPRAFAEKRVPSWTGR